MRTPALRRWKVRLTALTGLTLCLLGLVVATRTAWYESVRERASDGLLAAFVARPATASVAVVDIDRGSLQELGPWPWSRQRLAELVDAIGQGKPAALGIDILLAGDARAGLRSGEGSIDGGPAGAHDPGDQALAAALGRIPTALGVVLDPERPSALAKPTPALVRGGLEIAALWNAPGAIAADPVLAREAAGFGVIALPGDADGNVRRAPFLVAAGRLTPGLAVELARIAGSASALFVTADGDRLELRAGEATVRLAADGMLRLVPPRPESWPDRTVRAAALLGDATEAERLAGRIVVLGSSAPETGALRPSGSGLLVPSVQLQADAVEQVLAGLAPYRSQALRWAEWAVLITASVMALCVGLQLSPLAGAGIIAVVCLGWIAASVLGLVWGQMLLDPIVVPTATTASFAIATLSAAADTWQRERLLRRRFEQHLAPEVVRRIVEEPKLLKLDGELREVTSLFTDVEGFTAMTERSDPQALVRALDRYLDGLTQIAVEHGGMIDKIIGDGVHVLFNAPLDLPDHPARAVACARAILAFSERYRRSQAAAALKFGRTRIGIETGRAIVGDIGGGRRLDYTAHGNAINAASRLEAANKVLGSAICIGPGAAARLDGASLRPLGAFAIRGRTAAVAIHDLWPEEFGPGDRAEFLAVLELARSDGAAAAARFAALSQRFPCDGVLATFAIRLRESASFAAAAADGAHAAPGPGASPAT
jgi:adenylate cyclase